MFIINLVNYDIMMVIMNLFTGYLVSSNTLRKNKIKQWCSTNPSISAKPTTNSQIIKQKKHNEIIMTLEIQVLVWDRHKHVAGLNQLIES